MYDSKKYKKQWLAFSLIGNLGVLFFFKYFNFFALSTDQILQTFHIQYSLPQFKLLLPIGISFYTFQTIGYLMDVFRGKIKPEKHLGYFALFVSFFPTLASGPIQRAEELIPQLKKAHTFQYGQVVYGLKLFTFGLFKKMVIADNIAVIVDHTFDKLPEFKGFSLILTMVLFSWQIYMDFSGYTDMARGIAKILGIHVVENFTAPYLATSVQNFWQRWHMSLSRWFRDYLYIPLGGNRVNIWRTCGNILIVFTLCGLWHGAALPFVIWGFFHGSIVALERITGKRNTFQLPTLIKIFYTYILVCISWVFFRSETISDALYILRFSLVGIKNFMNPTYIWASISQLFSTNTVEMIITLGVLITAIVMEFVSKHTLSKIIQKQPTIIRYMLYILVILCIVQLRNANIKQFIYVRF